MMVNNSQQAIPQTGERMTVQEYFQLDYTVPNERYEYQNGMIRLMAGGSGEHDQIAYNIRAAIDINFQTGPCFVRGSDMRVQVDEDTYFYPDVTVSCDVADRRRGTKVIRSPRIVIEVLSPSTERSDHTDKLKAYQACPTIQEIVLIDQFRPYVKIYRRIEEDSTEWSHVVYESGEEVILESVDVYIPMEDIYRAIDFNEPLVEE
jgi:Uma2 family endonuclease